MNRREAIRMLAAAAGSVLTAGRRAPSEALATRPIPSSGELIPVIGIGTWRTFDVGSSDSERNPLQEVLFRFAERGGRVVDTSPMYGHAESVIGYLAAKLDIRRSLFLATKVWTTGRAAGIAQMEESLRKLRTDRVDLMQVHNLIDVETHLATLAEWKREGRIRYLGVTHYDASAYPRVEALLRREKLDFLEINYSLAEPEAEDRLLPLARERGVAVIVNRPFAGSELFERVRGKPVPAWARDLGCASWAQAFLKWILGNSAVACAIPGTGKLAHLEDNLQAGIGRFPDARERARIVRDLGS